VGVRDVATEGEGGLGFLESPQLFFETNFVILSKLSRNWGEASPLNVFIHDIKHKKCKR
jgi:hypothetical protein